MREVLSVIMGASVILSWMLLISGLSWLCGLIVYAAIKEALSFFKRWGI